MSNSPKVQEAVEQVIEKFENMPLEEFRNLLNNLPKEEEPLHIHSPEFLRET